MSLQTLEKKILATGKMPFWKFTLFFSVLPAVFATVIFMNLIPNFELFQTFDGRLFVLAILSVFLMICSFFVILTAYLVVKSLSRISEEITQRHGVFTAHALATNHEFLRNFANALLPKIIGFIRGYNDPKFEALENRIESLEENDIRKDRHIARQNQEIFALKWVLSRVLRKQEEEDQIINKKIQTYNKDEERK